MIEFNPDGSLKISRKAIETKQDNINKLKTQKCIKIRREVVSDIAPKSCVLKITLSDAINDSRFIENIYNYFKISSSTPMKLIKINDKEYQISVGTDFKRCTDCLNLRNRYNEFLDGNVIQEKSGCTFEGFRRNFSYEDYFE